MEMRFEKTTCYCLNPVLQQVQNQEQTQELRLGEGMPDVGRILGCWGQCVIRGKEWNGDTVNVSAGMMVWVLYAPEDGTQEQSMETWIPFQLRYDLGEDTPEGQLRVRCVTRFADARSVSARKIMIRAGIGMLAEGYVPIQGAVTVPPKDSEGVELKTATYPLRLPKEVGEKTFLLDEELSMPETAPRPEKIISCRLEPSLTDKRVLGAKAVFRGDGQIHWLYRGADGSLHSWETSVPFSQYAELNEERSPEAQADVAMTVTSLEPELGEDGVLRFKAGIAAQLLISDVENAQVVEDAYCPGRELNIQREELVLPVLLDSRVERMNVEQNAALPLADVVELRFLPDFPKQRQQDSGTELELGGTFQGLYRTPEGALQPASSRWEGSYRIPADSSCILTVTPQAGSVRAVPRGDGSELQSELAMQITALSRRGIPMVSALELGENVAKDPNRPSVILRRRDGGSLWDIAKECGSTVDAILRANDLQEEPKDNRMLLIPVK